MKNSKVKIQNKLSKKEMIGQYIAWLFVVTIFSCIATVFFDLVIGGFFNFFAPEIFLLIPISWFAISLIFWKTNLKNKIIITQVKHSNYDSFDHMQKCTDRINQQIMDNSNSGLIGSPANWVYENRHQINLNIANRNHHINSSF